MHLLQVATKNVKTSKQNAFVAKNKVPSQSLSVVDGDSQRVEKFDIRRSASITTVTNATQLVSGRVRLSASTRHALFRTLIFHNVV